MYAHSQSIDLTALYALALAEGTVLPTDETWSEGEYSLEKLAKLESKSKDFTHHLSENKPSDKLISLADYLKSDAHVNQKRIDELEYNYSLDENDDYGDEIVEMRRVVMKSSRSDVIAVGRFKITTNKQNARSLLLNSPKLKLVNRDSFRDFMDDAKKGTIAERLAALDRYTGKPVADHVRALFPELTELEHAEVEGRGSWAAHVGDERQVLAESKGRSLPEKAPALWAEAKEPGDTPPRFIETHYRAWLGKGLTRAHLRELDPQLYRAFSNWLQNPKHRLPEGFELPTKSETWIADPEDGTPPDVREARRIVSRWDKRQARARSQER